MLSIRSTDTITVDSDRIIIGPIIDRDKKIICNYSIELNQPLDLSSDNQLCFKDLKKILIEKNVRMIGMKPIDQIPMTSTDLLNDLEMIHMELSKARAYAEKNNCQQTRDILNNTPHKLFRMKDMASFEAYLDHINNILDQHEKTATEQIGNTLFNSTNLFADK